MRNSLSSLTDALGEEMPEVFSRNVRQRMEGLRRRELIFLDVVLKTAESDVFILCRNDENFARRVNGYGCKLGFGFMMAYREPTSSSSSGTRGM